MKKIYLLLIVFICIGLSFKSYGQSYTEFIPTDDFIDATDTSWSKNNVDFKLNTDWTHFYEDELLLFGGRFIVSFESFNHQVDSIVLHIENACPNDCFDLTLYKLGEDSIIIETPSGTSNQTFINLWQDNPDSLVLATWEGGIYSVRIYYQESSGQYEIGDKMDLVLFPNPADKFINLSYSGRIETIEIYDLNGSLLKKPKMLPAEIKVDISELSPGTYLVKTVSEEKVNILKFVKY